MSEPYMPETETQPDASWNQPPTHATSHGWAQPPAAQARRLYGSTEASRWQEDPELAARANADTELGTIASAAVAQNPDEISGGGYNLSGGGVPPELITAAMGRVFIPEATVCLKCDGTIDWDGYCEQCGAKAPSGRDHFEQVQSSWVAGVCDRGVRHSRNEDAMALWADFEPSSRAILAVCDGVSTSTDSDKASLAAANAAQNYLCAVTEWDWNLADLAPESPTRIMANNAVLAANQVVLANSVLDEVSPASCTIAIGLVNGTQILAVTVGDSRVYWFPDSGPAQLLSTDDSMAQQQIEAGVDRAIAESGIHSHVITRWLGPDSPDISPTLAAAVVEQPGWLLVCSDGLWNYASDPVSLGAVLAELVQRRPEAAVLEISRDLVAWANEKGGDDNITVALARLDTVHPGVLDQSNDIDLDAPTTRTRPMRQANGA